MQSVVSSFTITDWWTKSYQSVTLLDFGSTRIKAGSDNDQKCPGCWSERNILRNSLIHAHNILWTLTQNIPMCGAYALWIVEHIIFSLVFLYSRPLLFVGDAFLTSGESLNSWIPWHIPIPANSLKYYQVVSSPSNP